MQQILLGYTTAAAGGGDSQGSVLFDGSGDYLEVSKSTGFDFPNAFTMEAWVHAHSLPTDGNQYNALDSIFESIDWNSQNGQYSFGISHENKPYFYIFDGSNTFVYGNTVLSPHKWYHLLVSRDGSGGIRLFVNGSFNGSTSNNYSLSNSNQPNPARIGGVKINNSGSGVIQKSFDGYISNLRVLNGTALYTNSFPLTALPLTETSQGATNVKLLCCNNGSSAGIASVAPASPASTGVTVQGDTTHDTDNPFGTSTDGSISIDGNDSLIVPLQTLGVNDFTFECWFKAQTSGSPGNHDTLFALSNYGEGGSDNGPGNSFSFYAHNNGGLKIFTRSGGSFNNRYEQASLYSLNTWVHFAWTRESSSNRVFINGTETGNWSGQTDYSSGQDLYIGCNDYSRNGVPNEYGLNGNISNARVTIGQALYTSNFNLPSTALTTTSQGAIASNVKVLCCNSRTDATAATLPSAITVKGDSQSVSQSPFSTNNGVWIDRSDNQYMYTLNDSGIQFGTGDFTCECWFMWHSNNNDWQSIFGKYGSAQDNGWWLHLSAGGQLVGGDRGNGYATGTTVCNLHEWYHTALVRSGTTVSLYLNGVLEATHTSDDGGGVPRNCDHNGEFHIGHLQNIGRGWDGYISNMRCVKGQALYTSNFTPPTKPLTLTSQGAVESNVGFLGCQTPIVSAVSKGRAVNPNSYVKPSYGPFSGASGFGSVAFDGSDDFVEVAGISGNNPPWSFGTSGAFTIECWAWADSYALSGGWYKRMWSLSNNPAVNNFTDGITMEMDDGGSFRFRHDNSIYLSTSNVGTGTWYHVAFTRMEDGTMVIHLNGQAQASASGNTLNMDYGPHSVKIGEHHGVNNSSWNGKISNFHLHKGAKYSLSDFTKPEAPPDYSASTLILCCNDPSNATASLKNPSTITTSGNASASSSHPF